MYVYMNNFDELYGSQKEVSYKGKVVKANTAAYRWHLTSSKSLASISSASA